MDGMVQTDRRAEQGVLGNGVIASAKDSAGRMFKELGVKGRLVADTFEVDMSPEVAAKILATRAPNRRVNANNVRRIVSDIKRGAYVKTHQGIALNRDWQLIDGQNRLEAIVASGVTLPLRVTVDQPPEALQAIDTGGPRSMSQVMTLAYGVDKDHAATFTAVINAIVATLDKSWDLRLTPPEMNEQIKHYDAALRWLVSLPKLGSLPSAAQRAALVYAYHLAPDARARGRVATFAKHVTTWENVPPGASAHALRGFVERLGEYDGGQWRKAVVFATLTAIRAYMRGRTMPGALRISLDDVNYFRALAGVDVKAYPATLPQRAKPKAR